MNSQGQFQQSRHTKKRKSKKKQKGETVPATG
jgi:hypothetical protein